MEQLQNISKLIIKKKILLNFVITNYTLKDKIFSWIHILLAIIAPILALSQEKNCNDTQSFSSVVISFVVASLIKIKDYVKYDKIRDTAKKQNILYKELYDKIEIKILSLKNSKENIEKNSSQSSSQNTLTLPINNFKKNSITFSDDRKDLINFFKEVKKEYANIEKNDPDIKDSDKEKYIIECKKLGIEYIDDIDELKRLIIESTPKHGINPNKDLNQQHNNQQNNDNEEHKKQVDKQVEKQVEKQDNSNNNDNKINLNKQNKLKEDNYNNNKDLEWNLERLKQL